MIVALSIEDKRENRREHDSLVRRLLRVERKAARHDDLPGHEEMDMRVEDVEERLVTVEERVNLLAEYQAADKVLEG